MVREVLSQFETVRKWQVRDSIALPHIPPFDWIGYTLCTGQAALAHASILDRCISSPQPRCVIETTRSPWYGRTWFINSTDEPKVMLDVRSISNAGITRANEFKWRRLELNR